MNGIKIINNRTINGSRSVNRNIIMSKWQNKERRRKISKRYYSTFM